MPEGVAALVQQFGLPVAMLLVFIWAIYKKIFVPGWYAVFLEGLLATEKAKNEELEKKIWNFAAMARTAVRVGEAIIQKESSENPT